jgi:hypothetical protein
MNRPDDTALKSLWQQQPVEDTNMALKDIRSKANKFQSRIKIRNAVEYGAAVVVLFAFSRTLIVNLNRHHIVAVVGCALILAATLFIVYYLRQRGHATTPPVDGDMRTYLTYLILDVSRQRDLLRNIFWWYLAPFIPGLVTLTIAGVLYPPSHPKVSPAIGLAIFLGLLFIVYVGGYLLNQRAARKMQAGIEQAEAALKALDSDAAS